MNINELKNELANLVHKRLYESYSLDKNDEKTLENISLFLNKSDNLIDDLKTLLSSKNNENYYAYDEYVRNIFKKLDPSLKLDILNDSTKYNDIITNNDIFLDIWNSISVDDKVDYLLKKKKFCNLDYTIINEECKSTNDFKKNKVLKELFNNNDLREKLDSFSITLSYSKNLLKHINLNDYDLCSLFTKESYTNLLLKKCESFKDFINLYKNNHKIYNLLSRNSLIFKNEDNEKIHDFIVENPNFIGKFNLRYLELFSIIEISKLSKYKNLDSDAFSTIIVKLYKYDNTKANDYFNEDNLKKCSRHSIDVNPFADLDLDIKNMIFNNYSLFNKFLDTIMIEAINEHFEEDDIVNLLRNDVFVDDISSYAIELMLNKLSFKSSFNMLQRKNILNKVNHLNVSLNTKDIIFIKGYLDSPILVYKSDHLMIYEMLNHLNNADVLYYIVLPYIVDSLTSYEVTTLLLDKKIDINFVINNKVILNKINKNELIEFIDKYWKDNLDLSIFKNNELMNILFDIDSSFLNNINIDEVNYLYESIRTKSILSKQEVNCTISNYKCVLASYLTFGLDNTLKIVLNGNKDITLEDVKKVQKNVIEEKLERFKLDNQSIFNNMFEQVVDNLLNLKRTNDIAKFSKLVSKNTYLDNCIYLMLESNYDDYNTIINKFFSFVTYYDRNPEMSRKDIEEYVNKFVSELFLKKENEFKNEFEEIILNNFRPRESVLFKERKKTEKSLLQRLKLKLFIRTLSDPKKEEYMEFFKEGYPIWDVKEKYINYLKNEKQEFINILEHVLIPFSNDRLDYENCLNHLGINKPENYDKYIGYSDNIKNLALLNHKVDLLKKKYNVDEILSIMNYLCYDIEITFKIKNSELVKFNRLKELANKINKEIYIDKSALKFIYNDNIDIYNIEEVIEYKKYNEIIDSIIKKTNRYISINMDDSKVKNYYIDDFYEIINKQQYTFEINDSNYELKKRVFVLNDIETIFKGCELKNLKLDKSIYDFLEKNHRLIMLADGYYKGIIDNFGIIISNWSNIIEYIFKLKDNLSNMSIIDIANIIKIVSFKDNTLFDWIDANVIRSISDYNYYEIKDLNKRFNILVDLYKGSFKQVYSTLPYLSYKEEIYTVKFIDKYNIDYLKAIDNSSYRIGAVGNDLLIYSLLSKNGCQIGIYENDELIAKTIGVRNGNALFLNGFESIKDINYVSLIKNFCNELLKLFHTENDSIDFVTIVNNNYYIDENGFRIDTALYPNITYPLPIEYNDYKQFKKNDCLINKNNIYTNFDKGVTTLVASNIVVDKNNFKCYDVEAKYQRKRNDVIKLSNNVSDEYLDKINTILYLTSSDKKINLDSVITIYLGDDYVLLVGKDGKIDKYILNYDDRNSYEIDIIIKEIEKEKI